MCFILSGAISNCLLLFPSSILDIFQLGGLIFWYHIFLPCHTIHGVLMARILEWFVISSTNGPHFVRTLHYDLSILVGPAWYGTQLHWVTQALHHNEAVIHEGGKRTWTVSYLSSVKLLIRRRWWHPTPVLLPEKSHGWWSLVGCSPWGR